MDRLFYYYGAYDYAFFSQKEQNVRYAMHTAMTITEPV